MKPLIIVESYTKTKTISKYLDNKYNVICSLGHINNLPPNDLGINVTDWTGTYIDTNEKIIKNIRTNVKNANVIYIASDPDMEGEAIAHHVKNSIKDLLKDKKCYRIEFHEITKKAINKALENPRDINKYKVDAQESRRFVDRLVGYKLSPLLWKVFDDNQLSVGRVQTVALYMCVELLNNIMKHIINPYWNIIGIFTKPKLIFKLYDINNNIIKVDTKEKVEYILNNLNLDDKFKIKFNEKKTEDKPLPPYTTTTLQQDAYNKYRFSSKKTMQLAQKLYELGHITYMRTDSTNISNDFKNLIINYVKETYGETNAQFRNFKNKISNAQEAHEAIRITNIDTLLIDVTEEHNKLYQLIWKRTISSQMINAEYIDLDIIIEYQSISDIFIYKKSFLKTQGYLLVYNTPLEDIDDFKKKINDLKANEFIGEANINHPPSLYNEISLIKALEKEGIGRPSTFTSIIDKILSKKYIQKGYQEHCDGKKELIVTNYVKSRGNTIENMNVKISIVSNNKKDYLIPTELGIKIIEYAKKNISFLLNKKFTANLENALDKICLNEITKTYVLTDFYMNYILPLTKDNIEITKGKDKKSGFIKTKYGVCYFNADTNKYINIESYLIWKKKTVDELTEKEKDFLKSLPKKINDTLELHIGPYGLYIKEKNKNIRLDKSKWNEYI